MIMFALARAPIGETDPAAHEQAVRQIDWASLWRRKEGVKSKERRK